MSQNVKSISKNSFIFKDLIMFFRNSPLTNEYLFYFVFVRLFDYFFILLVFIGLLISTPQSSSPETLLVDYFLKVSPILVIQIPFVIHEHTNIHFRNHQWILYFQKYCQNMYFQSSLLLSTFLLIINGFFRFNIAHIFILFFFSCLTFLFLVHIHSFLF